VAALEIVLMAGESVLVVAIRQVPRGSKDLADTDYAGTLSHPGAPEEHAIARAEVLRKLTDAPDCVRSDPSLGNILEEAVEVPPLGVALKIHEAISAQRSSHAAER
jgi:hypothetical protein